MPSAHTTSLERFAPWVAGALIALPVLLSRYPPMADMPPYDAVIGLLRHWGDPAFVPANIYQLNLGLGNQLFYFLILSIAYVVSVGTATKLVVAATLLLLPVATARLAEHLSVTRWAAVIVTPIGLGWLFYWGMLANLMGLTLYLFLLPTLDRFCDRPTARRLAGACGWIVLLHFTHDFMTLIACGTLVLFTVCAWRSWRENVARVVPVMVGLALVFSTRATMARLLSKEHTNAPKVEWLGFAHKLTTLPGALYAGYEPWVRNLIFVVCVVPAILFGIERWRNRAANARTWREQLHDWRFEILGASLVFSYFAAPVNAAPATTLIYHRFLAPAWIVLTLTACTRVKLAAPWGLPRMLAAVVPLAPLLTSLPAFAESDRVFTDLDAAITHLEPGATYLVLELGRETDRSFVHPFLSVGYVVAARGGRGLYDYTSFEASPVYLRNDKQWTTIVQRMAGESYAMLPAYDLTHFRYVLLHSTDATITTVATLALMPEARAIAHEKEWTVLESTLPLVPIDAPDEPTPKPTPKSLHERCLEVAARIRNTPM